MHAFLIISKRKVKEKKSKKLYATKLKKGTCEIMASG
jgi:hypothetical protein